MIIRTKVERPPWLSKRAHTRCMRSAHQAEGEVWQSQILRSRFENHHYPHKERTAGYLAHKHNAAVKGIAKYGGNQINVYTGAMQQMATSSAVVHAYPSRVTITFSGPRYMVMRNFRSVAAAAKAKMKFGNQPNKAEELLQIAWASERNLLTRTFESKYHEERDRERALMSQTTSP